MKSVCLVYLVEKEMEAMSESEAEACTDESLAYDEALRRSGQLIVAQALAPVETATTVRVRKGRLTATDGPFAETKEQLLGFYIVDCASLEEAIAAAKGMVDDHGAMEIRPLRLFRPGATVKSLEQVEIAR
jgi:hypothetical protein